MKPALPTTVVAMTFIATIVAADAVYGFKGAVMATLSLLTVAIVSFAAGQSYNDNVRTEF